MDTKSSRLPVLRSLIVRALWALRASAWAGWIRSLRTQSDGPLVTLPAPEELAFFIINLLAMPELVVAVANEPLFLLVVVLLPCKVNGTAAAAMAKLVVSSTGVAGALTLPRPSRSRRDAVGGASKRFRKSSRPPLFASPTCWITWFLLPEK